MHSTCKGYLARTRALLTAISETWKVRSALFYVCEERSDEVIAVNERRVLFVTVEKQRKTCFKVVRTIE